MKQLLVLFLALVLAWPARAQANAEANKALFDRTVDKLNFQTMEGVYDARFVRKKFPVNLTGRAERRDFKEFNGDEAFAKLFLNYNDEAEKYKNRFGPGHGATTLTTFDKGLRSILIDANFEFFIRVLRRDDKQALIKKLEGTIKEAVAQYDASGEPQAENRQPDTLTSPTEDGATPADEAVAAADQVDALNGAVPAGNGEAEQTAAAAPAGAGRGGWGGSLALILALAAVAGVAYLLFVVVPGLRAQTAAMAHEAPAEVVVDDHLPVTYAAESQQRATELRFALLSDEVDELKARIEELEVRLAYLLVAPPEEAPAPAPEYFAPVAHAGPDSVHNDDEAELTEAEMEAEEEMDGRERQARG